ncbi:MAG: hypothetical protein NVS3B29_07730 [Candidatus Saccharimonadales bacterium]
MKMIDRYLDRLTTYQVIFYYLIFLVAAAIALSSAGVLHYDPVGLAFSAGYLALASAAANWIFAKTFYTSVNPDSSYITGLILALIITPVTSHNDILFFTAAAGLAIASKFLLALGGKHIFNPAAAGVVLTALGAGQAATWWVGSAPMMGFVLAGGLLVLRRLREWGMVAAFLAASFASAAIFSLLSGGDPVQALQRTLLQTAVLFLGVVMLTEPQTAPRTQTRQLWYAGIVGGLLSPQIHVGSVYTTPELALIAGNIYAWFVSPRYSTQLALSSKHHLSSNTADYIFTPKRLPSYLPGQYMEWTLPHHGVDSRGDRRFFTLASSPTENNLRLGVKFHPRGSSYKQALQRLPAGGRIKAGQISGDFVLPDDPSLKLAFIAGGVGVTPYRSMVKYLLDTGGRRDIKLLYAERATGDFIYTDVFEAAGEQFGLAATYFLTAGAASTLGPHQQPGRITAAAIAAQIPDYLERRFYISGPPAMTSSIVSDLNSFGVPGVHIKTDYFTGYEAL